jgi:DNA-binding MarR family transcriptional regulator/FixJ family two-component response regulator
MIKKAKISRAERISRPKKVLVADDDQDVLDDVELFLGRLGLSFGIARNVDQAVRDLKNDRAIEVLLVGTRMLKAAEFFLLECLGELQRQGRTIRTILMSNYAGLQLMQRAMQLGVADLLHGPLSLGDIGPAVLRASSLNEGDADARHSGHQPSTLMPLAGAAFAQLPLADAAAPGFSHAHLPLAANDERALLSQLLTLRSAQHRFLDAELFSYPCWNMILDLAIAERDERTVSVTSLCWASGVPLSTALRHLDGLVERQFLVRHPDDKDHRRILVSLTDNARTRLKELLQELARLEFLSHR